MTIHDILLSTISCLLQSVDVGTYIEKRHCCSMASSIGNNNNKLGLINLIHVDNLKCTLTT